MESAKQDTNPLHQILPPRLEDAGLEECALPPESIKQAFFKAASAVKSRAASVLHSDEDEYDDDSACVNDPWPTAKDPSDVGPCAVDKGSEIGGFDEVKVGGFEDDDEDGVRDKVIVGEEEERDCVVDGLRGLDIEDDGKKNSDEEEEGKKRPTLVEGFV